MDGGKFYITRLDPGEITRYMETLNAFVEKGVPVPDPDAPPAEVVEAGFELAHNFMQNQHLIANSLELIAASLERIALSGMQPKGE